MRGRPLATLLSVALAAACASPAPSTSPVATPVDTQELTTPPTLTPTPSPSPSTPAPSTPPPTPTASPSSPLPTDAAPPPIQGVWASQPITHEMIAAAVRRRGATEAEVVQLVGAHAFVDYIVYELVVTDSDWKVNEVPDGLPWGSWNGAYHMPNPRTVVATDGLGKCQLTFRLDFSDTDVAITVRDDSCGPADGLLHVATFEAATFRRVEGPGAPAAALYTTTRGTSIDPSTSHQRLRKRPLGSVEDAPLGYVEYLPPAYGRRDMPLLVALHGSGQSGAGDAQSLSQLYELGIPLLLRDGDWPDSLPFVVLAPQHTWQAPAVCITPDEIAAFLAFALDHYEVDPERVYLTGLSCGAIGAWNYLGEHLDETVAAAVLVAGGGYGPIDDAGCALARVPIWALHGARDEVVPTRYGVNSMARLQACTDPPPVDARLTLYEDVDHDSWTRTYDLSAGYDIYDWLLRYRKTPSGRLEGT